MSLGLVMTVVADSKNNNLNLCDRCHGKNHIIECACGCGQLRFLYDKKGKLRTFINFHQNRGINHHNYKNGIHTDRRGYKHSRNWDHPHHNPIGYVPVHRLIYEHYLSIMMDEEVFLPRKYEVHHIIPVTKEHCDNSLINLELLTHQEHMSRHKSKDKSNRMCVKCGSGITNDKWYGNEKDGWKCNKCYLKEYKRRNK